MHHASAESVPERAASMMTNRSFAPLAAMVTPPASHTHAVVDDILVLGPTSHSNYLVRYSQYGTLVAFTEASVETLSGRLDAVKRRLGASNASIFASRVAVMALGADQSIAYGWILHSPVADARAYDDADTTSPG
jgi:hypothetical protein